MERTKIKFPDRSGEGSTPPPRRKSIMPNMARVQMVEAVQSNPPAENIPEPDMPLAQTSPQRKKKKFEDTYTRYTSYLKNPILGYVLELREQGHIESATALVNNALLEYIKKHFGKSFEL